MIRLTPRCLVVLLLLLCASPLALPGCLSSEPSADETAPTTGRESRPADEGLPPITAFATQGCASIEVAQRIAASLVPAPEGYAMRHADPAGQVIESLLTYVRCASADLQGAATGLFLFSVGYDVEPLPGQELGGVDAYRYVTYLGSSDGQVLAATHGLGLDGKLLQGDVRIDSQGAAITGEALTDMGDIQSSGPALGPAPATTVAWVIGERMADRQFLFESRTAGETAGGQGVQRPHQTGSGTGGMTYVHDQVLHGSGHGSQFTLGLPTLGRY